VTATVLRAGAVQQLVLQLKRCAALVRDESPAGIVLILLKKKSTGHQN
jgi:hypothetical protein